MRMKLSGPFHVGMKLALQQGGTTLAEDRG